MQHLILWMQAVGVGAGVHPEGQHGGAHQVPQEVVQKHTWHIGNVVRMIAKSWDHLLKIYSSMVI